MLGLQTDFAMLFKEHGKFVVYLGKVQRLIKRVGVRRLVEYQQPVNIDTYDSDSPIFLVAVWYKPATEVDGAAGGKAQHVYELSTDQDLYSYDIKHVITPVHFVNTDVIGQSTFALTTRDKDAIDAAVATVQHAVDDGEHPAHGQKRTSQQMEDDGRVTIAGASSRGRHTTMVSFTTR
jgi:hypothetical protein